MPVIAVPTSVGYGASFGGLAALLSMLNSCANGIGVVNIDNGYGAACLANKIMKRQEHGKGKKSMVEKQQSADVAEQAHRLAHELGLGTWTFTYRGK